MWVDDLWADYSQMCADVWRNILREKYMYCYRPIVHVEGKI